MVAESIFESGRVIETDGGRIFVVRVGGAGRREIATSHPPSAGSPRPSGSGGRPGDSSSGGRKKGDSLSLVPSPKSGNLPSGSSSSSSIGPKSIAGEKQGVGTESATVAERESTVAGVETASASKSVDVGDTNRDLPSTMSTFSSRASGKIESSSNESFADRATSDDGSSESSGSSDFDSARTGKDVDSAEGGIGGDFVWESARKGDSVRTPEDSRGSDRIATDAKTGSLVEDEARPDFGFAGSMKTASPFESSAPETL
jgi:hypothetical protein